MSVTLRITPRTATPMIGAIRGISISNVRRQKPAPSMSEASRISVGIASIPAMTMTAASGTIRQVWTMITEARARRGWPSQIMLPSSSPSWRSTQSMGLKIVSRVHSQLIVASDTGVVHGSRTRRRISHLNLKSLVRISARAVARITTRALETTVKNRVLRSARQNTGSSNTWRSVSSPTKSRLGSPTVTSLNAISTARTNGNPTRATM